MLHVVISAVLYKLGALQKLQIDHLINNSAQADMLPGA